MKERGYSMYDDIDIRLVADGDTLRNELGYDEYDDSEELELERGYSYDSVEIEDDGTFVIPDGYHGEIESYQEFYELVEIQAGYFEREPLGFLSPGRYKIGDDCVQKIGECNHWN